MAHAERGGVDKLRRVDDALGADPEIAVVVRQIDTYMDGKRYGGMWSGLAEFCIAPKSAARSTAELIAFVDRVRAAVGLATTDEDYTAAAAGASGAGDVLRMPTLFYDEEIGGGRMRRTWIRIYPSVEAAEAAVSKKTDSEYSLSRAELDRLLPGFVLGSVGAGRAKLRTDHA